MQFFTTKLEVCHSISSQNEAILKLGMNSAYDFVTVVLEKIRELQKATYQTKNIPFSSRIEQRAEFLNKMKFTKKMQAIFDLLDSVVPKDTHSEDMLNLLADTESCDYTLKLSSLEFKCHSFILKYRCPALFSESGKYFEFDNPDLSPKLIDAYLRYIYTGEIGDDAKIKFAVKVFSVYPVTPYKEAMRQCIEENYQKNLVLKCEEGTVEVHKILVTLRSNFFKAALQEKWVQSGQKEEFYFEDISLDSLKCFVEYLYLGSKVDIHPNQALEILCYLGYVIDDRFQHILEHSIESGLDMENILAVYQMVHLHASQTLVENLFQKILSNYDILSKKEDFQDLPPKALKRLYVFKNPDALKILEREEQFAPKSLFSSQEETQVDPKVLKKIRQQKDKEKKIKSRKKKNK